MLFVAAYQVLHGCRQIAIKQKKYNFRNLMKKCYLLAFKHTTQAASLNKLHYYHGKVSNLGEEMLGYGEKREVS